VPVKNFADISATPIREAFFTDELKHELPALSEVPGNVYQHLANFLTSEEYRILHDEHVFISHYKSKWTGLPYPPTYVTVDAVVVQSGHILLVERRSYPGKGLWALPGGFVGHDETLINACIRELREETRLKVPGAVLRGALNNSAVFDEPNRSTRGRTITHAFYFVIEPEQKLPVVKGGKKIGKAFWLPLAKLEPTKMFEDHYHIIQTMVGA
jgi:bifunctional NMN adenylyltransferase/nudix hydrolase